MANAKFDLGQAGVTDYLILRARKVSAPATETARIVLGPAPATINNFLFTGLELETYYFDLYESINGVLLSFLFGTFTFDVKNQTLISEKRFYVVDRGNTGDPVSGTATLTDAYFNNKNINGLFQRAYGYLIPAIEYSITGTTITLLNGQVFSAEDVYMVEIDYTVSDTSTITTSFFAGIKVVTANVTTDGNYYNRRIQCNGLGTQLVITLENYITIPDGKFFYFVDNNGGAQNQTKILVTAGTILFNGQSLAEIWLGKGEHLWLEKNGSVFEVISAHANLQMVGQRFAAGTINHINCLPENGAVYAALDYPRLWWWINNKLSFNLFVLDNAMTAGAYTRPVNREGQFIISVSNQVFRMPNTQNFFERGLKNFNVYGADAARLFDYPGGRQDESVGPLNVTLAKGNGYTGSSTSPGRFAPGLAASPQPNDLISITTGSETRPTNFGVIFMRHI